MSGPSQPKLPLGMAGGAPNVWAVPPGHVHHAEQPLAADRSIAVRHGMQRSVTVSYVHPTDYMLLAIQDRISPFLSLVADPDDIVAALKELAAAGPRNLARLDLVNHAHHGLISFGTWTIDDNPQTTDFANNAAPHLKKLGIHTIRLLGCGTLEFGAAAIVAFQGKLHSALGPEYPISVEGTNGFLFEDDFDYHGFSPNSESKLGSYP